jgi:sugar phosphate isomerase/epimerase
MISRRKILAITAAAFTPIASTAAPRKAFRLGAMDMALQMRGNPAIFEAAASLGLEGVELVCGTLVDGKLPMSDHATQDSFLREARKHRLAVAGVVLNVLHPHPLKSDARGEQFIAPGIEIAARMKARVLLLPFFNQGALEGSADIEHVGQLLRSYAAEAGKQGIVLGLENTMSAEDNARLLDRIGSPHASVYYDVGNSTNTGGFDAPKEIRWLGRERICQIHLKDKGYLGEGKVNFPEVIKAMREIGFQGFANFETRAPSGNAKADLKRHTDYIRGLMST